MKTLPPANQQDRRHLYESMIACDKRTDRMMSACKRKKNVNIFDDCAGHPFRIRWLEQKGKSAKIQHFMKKPLVHQM